jgi:hypothetical protein
MVKPVVEAVVIVGGSDRQNFVVGAATGRSTLEAFGAGCPQSFPRRESDKTTLSY